MPRVFMWLLPVRLHAVHHGVVLQGQALLPLEGRTSIHPCHPGHCLAVPDKSIRVWPRPHQGWESWGRCATEQHTLPRGTIDTLSLPSLLEAVCRFTEHWVGVIVPHPPCKSYAKVPN